MLIKGRECQGSRCWVPQEESLLFKDVVTVAMMLWGGRSWYVTRD
jgi:hypothetical protein